MSKAGATGLLLVTHAGIATALLEQACRILDDPMDSVCAFEVGDSSDDDRAGLARQMAKADQGSGVLVLTDLPGATPANLARKLGHPGARLVSGLSLPMLIRAWNYRDRPLDELTALALEGGRSAMVELD